MKIDQIALRASLIRLEDAKFNIEIAIRSVQEGWVDQQLQRILNSIGTAKRSTNDAAVLLKRGARRYEQRKARRLA